jgi:hypothetical protein
MDRDENIATLVLHGFKPVTNNDHTYAMVQNCANGHVYLIGAKNGRRFKHEGTIYDTDWSWFLDHTLQALVARMLAGELV